MALLKLYVCQPRPAQGGEPEQRLALGSAWASGVKRLVRALRQLH